MKNFGRVFSNEENKTREMPWAKLNRNPNYRLVSHVSLAKNYSSFFRSAFNVSFLLLLCPAIFSLVVSLSLYRRIEKKEEEMCQNENHYICRSTRLSLLFCFYIDGRLRKAMIVTNAWLCFSFSLSLFFSFSLISGEKWEERSSTSLKHLSMMIVAEEEQSIICFCFLSLIVVRLASLRLL